MTILFVGIGSNPTFISRRIRGLLKNGISVKIMSEVRISNHIDRKAIFVPIFSNLKDPNVAIQAIISILLNISSLFKTMGVWKDIPGNNYLHKLKFFFRYHRIISDNYDLIHFQWVNHVKNFEWIKKLKKVPMIASARGSMVTVYPAVRKNYNTILLKSFKVADYVHCVSNDIRQYCIKWGADLNKCFVNYNGIDTNRYCPVIRQNKTSIKLISVGTLMWRKGFHWQLLIMSTLRSHGIESKLVIIGDGPDIEGLSYQCKKLGLTDHVSFLGMKTEEEVIKELQNSDIYLSTSAAEGLSNSVMEAASCGLPVVVFDCEGMREIIKNEETGYIVEYGNLTDFVDKIQQLIEDPVKRVEMGKNARNFVCEHFRIEDQVEQMILKYKEIAGIE